MHLSFNKIRQDVELIFELYRKHKYYTLFMNDYNTSVTSQIDRIGGGKSNKTSDKVADAAIRLVDEKQEAMEFVNLIERAVLVLPPIEQQLIKERYMKRDHDYISDYTVYEIRMNPPVSAPYYDKLRRRAFDRLHVMLKDCLISV